MQIVENEQKKAVCGLEIITLTLHSTINRIDMTWSENTTDEELLQQIRLKNHQAFNLLYMRYRFLVLNWIYYRTHERQVTQDIAQNFWIKLWENAAMFKTDEDGSIKKFLLKSLTYCTIDYLKSVQARKEGVGEDNWNVICNRFCYTHIMEDIEKHELKDILLETLKSLPELTQKVFDLRWNHQFTTKKTAEIIQLSEKNVKTRYKEAKEVLKTVYVRMWDEE